MDTPTIQVCAYRHCERPIEGKLERALYCSRSHKEAEKKARTPRPPAAPPQPRSCTLCGGVFTPDPGPGRTPSRCTECLNCRSCGARLTRKTKSRICYDCTPRKPKPEPEPWSIVCPNCKTIFEGPRHKTYCDTACARQHRHKLRAAAAAAGERFRDDEIYERDGWICQLCGKPIDRAAFAPDPLSRSIDHKVPVSAGGLHTRANVQAAHRDCNMRKGRKH